MSEVLNLLQKRIDEEKESRNFEIKDLNGVIEKLLKQFKVKNIHPFFLFSMNYDNKSLARLFHPSLQQ